MICRELQQVSIRYRQNRLQRRVKKNRKADLRVKDAISYLKNQNAVLEIMYPPSLQEMPGWISSRARRLGLYIDPDAAVFLSSAYEGNLTAIDQCLQIVKMTAKNRKNHN